MKIIAIANQKGGTAKTTTAAALAVLLARAGIRTHLIDMDPQASLTRAFGMADESDGLYHALTDRAGLPVRTVSRNLTLTPSTIELGRAESELLSETGREYFLRTSLEKTPLPDITGLLDGLLSPARPAGREHGRTGQSQRTRTTEKLPPPSAPISPIAVRRGRPPGSAGRSSPKEKVTVWINMVIAHRTKKSQSRPNPNHLFLLATPVLLPHVRSPQSARDPPPKYRPPSPGAHYTTNAPLIHSHIFFLTDARALPA